MENKISEDTLIELAACDDVEQPRMLSALNLAFIGDGVFEILVRQHLLKKGSLPMGKLHRSTVSLVCAKAQSEAVELILPLLTEEETSIYKRGRNATGAGVPRHSDPADYRRATGLETLFGYLYLTKRTDRIALLFDAVINNVNR